MSPVEMDGDTITNLTSYEAIMPINEAVSSCNCSSIALSILCERASNHSTFNVTSTFCEEAILEEEYWWDLKSLMRSKSGFRRIMDIFNLYLTPVIIILGLAGNILSFLVFSMSHLRRNSSSVYLAALALVDSGFLLSLFIVWLDKVNVPLFHQQVWCQIVVYLTHVCPFLSVWNVVGFTAERYVIVWHPLRKDLFCTPKKTKLSVCILSAIGLVLYSFTTWTSGVLTVNGGPSMCVPFPQYYDVLTFLTSIDAALTLILPSVIIIVLNIRILIRIQRIQKRMVRNQKHINQAVNHSKVLKKSTLKASISDKGSMHFRFSNRSVTDAEVTFLPPTHINDNTQSKSTVAFKGRSQYRLARMLLVVSSIFVLLNIPSHYFKIQAFMQHLFGYSYKSSKRELQWHEFFQLVYYMNFAINFFVYSLCGRPFRSGLRRLILRMRHNVKNCCQKKQKDIYII